jgi:hypothetical protein
VFDVKLQEKYLAMYDEIKKLIRKGDSNGKSEWHEYKKTRDFSVYTRDEQGAEGGGGIHGIFINAVCRTTGMLTIIGVNGEVD